VLILLTCDLCLCAKVDSYALAQDIFAIEFCANVDCGVDAVEGGDDATE